ncbi:MAG: hypothetical protein U0798_04995 [Gemmataceae bacterium]
MQRTDAMPPGEHHTADDLLPAGIRRFIPILATIAGSLAFVGFMVGIREPGDTDRPVARDSVSSAGIPHAVAYRDMPTAKLGANANWEQNVGQLKFDRPDPFAPVVRTDEMKKVALADRMRNRAYDGAPPTIPHVVSERSVAACLVCHQEGLKVGDRVASRMSHALLTNCTQCHVESVHVDSPFRNDTVETNFLGQLRSGPGQRASAGAPPSIPHRTFMRENCASCHGLLTRAGIRTTHPWLTNCTQCHAPSAQLDQVDFAGFKR